MARKSLKQASPKSPWLHGKSKKPEKALKPVWPLAKGTISCGTKECGTIEVQAYAEVVMEWPHSKFWFTGYCQTCGKLITGWAVINEN